VVPPAAAVHRQDAARGLATAHQPLRIAAGAEPLALVTEVKFFTWTDNNLLRQVVYEGLREDKPAAAGRRPTRNPPRRRALPFARGGRAAEVSRRDRPAERGQRFLCGVCLVNLTKWLALTGNERNS